MRFTTSELDRARFGLDEWTEFDATRCTVREAALLQGIGYDTPHDWLQALNGIPVIENGKPVYIYDDDGEILTVDGERVVKRRIDYLAWGALLWLALRRRGDKRPFDEIDFDLRAFRWEADPEPEPGKDPATLETTSGT